jgi:hypothetical protein
MADALTFTIGADTTKLRADMAVAQAAVRQLGSQLRAAASESLKTGETSGALQTLAARFETASASVGRLRARLAEARGATTAFAQDVKGVESAVEAGEIGLNRFSHAFGDLRGVIGAISPEIREFAEVGLVVGLVGAANHAADAIHQLEVQAAALGTTTERLERWNYVAAQAGVSSEAFARGLERFAAVLGKAQEAEQKLGDGAALASEEQGLAADRQRAAADQASDAIVQAAADQRKAQTAFEAAQLSAQKLTDSYNALRAGTSGLTAVIAPNAAANDKAVLAREKLNDSFTEAQMATERLAEAQDALGAAARRGGEAQARQTLGMREAGVEQDKLLRQAQTASETAAGPFALLGIDPAQIHDAVQGFELVLEKLRQIPDAAKRANIMSQFFDRRLWAEIAPLINLTADATKRLGDQAIVATKGEESAADRFFKSWQALKTALEEISTAVGNIVGQIFPPLFDALTSFFTQNKEQIRTLVQAAVDDANFFIDGWMKAFKLLKLGFDVLHLASNAVASDINKVFGTDVSGMQLIVGIGGAELLLPRIGRLFIGLASTVGKLAGAIMALPQAFAVARAAAIAFGAAADIAFAPVLAVIGPVGLIVVGIAAVGAALLTLTDSWGEFFDAVTHPLETLIKTWQHLKDLVSSVAEQTGQGIAAGGNGDAGVVAPAGAGGGRISGPGTGTSDSILARVSAGEYIVRSSQVTSRTLPLLAAINAGRFALGGLVEAFRNPFPGLAMGGLIAPMPAFAGGGSVPGGGGAPMSVIHLNIAGEHFGPMLADEDVAASLGRYATGRRMASAGAKPSWYGPGKTGG